MYIKLIGLLYIMLLAFVFKASARNAIYKKVGEVILNPPAIERMMIKTYFAGSGSTVYSLLIHQEGDFVVKRGEDLEQVKSNLYHDGVSGAGRIGDVIWVLDGEIILMATDLHAPIIPPDVHEGRHVETLLKAYGVSRGAWSVFSLGIQADPFGERNVIENRFFIRGVEKRLSNEGEFKIISTIEDNYEMVVDLGFGDWEDEAFARNYRVKAIINSDGIPIRYSVYQIDPEDGGLVLGYETEVLEVKLATSPLDTLVFRPEAYFQPIFLVGQNLSNVRFGTEEWFQATLPKPRNGRQAMGILIIAIVIPATAVLIIRALK